MHRAFRASGSQPAQRPALLQQAELVPWAVWQVLALLEPRYQEGSAVLAWAASVVSQQPLVDLA